MEFNIIQFNDSSKYLFFTQEEMMAWMESIRKSISKDPFYAQMQARKKNAMCKQWRNELT